MALSPHSIEAYGFLTRSCQAKFKIPILKKKLRKKTKKLLHYKLVLYAKVCMFLL